MRSIVAYHPEIHVTGPNSHHVITGNLTDFEDDADLLRRLAVSLGVSTAGEVVDSIRNVGVYKGLKVLQWAGGHNKREWAADTTVC